MDGRNSQLQQIDELRRLIGESASRLETFESLHMPAQRAIEWNRYAQLNILLDQLHYQVASNTVAFPVQSTNTIPIQEYHVGMKRPRGQD